MLNVKFKGLRPSDIDIACLDFEVPSKINCDGQHACQACVCLCYLSDRALKSHEILMFVKNESNNTVM